MKFPGLMPKLSIGFGAVCFITAAHAGIPVWSFTPDTIFPPKTSVTTTGTVLVRYTVRNNSLKSHNLVIKPQTGVTQNGPCKLGPRNSSSATCTLQLTITGSALPATGLSGGPKLCQTNPNGTANPNLCYQPGKGDGLAVSVIQGTPILSASSTNLALSISNTALNPALMGNPRQIIITNNGDGPTTGLSINYPSWPSGTTIDTSSPSACANNTILAAGGSCTITIVPGITASSGAGNAECTDGIEPISGTVSVTASNANQTSTNVVVLGYGCQFQGGFLYAVDDSYADFPISSSIGGKVVSLVDQAPPYTTAPQLGSIVWSSNGDNSTTADFHVILGIDETSTTSIASPTVPAYPPGTPAFVPCNGNSDGACDTNNIVSYYNFNRASGGSAPTPLTFYASGLCEATINGYTDWYLPAICEMDAVNLGVACPMGTQSMVGSLPFLVGDRFVPSPSTSCTPPVGTDCLSGYYWSSTEYSTDPLNSSWYEVFDSQFGSSQNSGAPKSSLLGARCSRALTP